MRALTFQSVGHVSVEDVPDPRIEEPTDAVIRVTSTAICGSDLHLLDSLGPFIGKGDVLGHEPMGVVEELGAEVEGLSVGDRVVIPFVIACGHCLMCRRGYTSQCETTQNRETQSGASLYGYTELYGSIPGGQAQYLRVPLAGFNAQKVKTEMPDERYLFLSDILPTAWQGVEYAAVPEGGTLAVLGLGPVGQLAARIGVHRGLRVIAVDPVPERRAMAERHGVETMDLDDDVAGALRDRTDGRGPESVVDAVGMEAHGDPGVTLAQDAIVRLPDAVARPLMQKVGVDRLAALHTALDAVQRGGTVSLSGVYVGNVDPMPMLHMFDKGIALRMGQCNVHTWRDEILPMAEDPADPFGLDDFVTNRVPLEQAPEYYLKFRDKEDGVVKVVLDPHAAA